MTTKLCFSNYIIGFFDVFDRLLTHETFDVKTSFSTLIYLVGFFTQLGTKAVF